MVSDLFQGAAVEAAQRPPKNYVLADDQHGREAGHNGIGQAAVVLQGLMEEERGVRRGRGGSQWRHG